MKRIGSIIVILFSLTACNSNEKAAEIQKAKEDSIRLRQEEDSIKAAQIKQAERDKETTIVSKTSETDVNAAKEKKGMSNTAKGAIIGAGVGAVTGAVVSKKHGKGAVIGGVIGAGVGAGTGAIIDKKKKKKHRVRQ